MLRIVRILRIRYGVVARGVQRMRPPTEHGDPPSPRQRVLLRHLERLTEKHGYPPTIRELARAMGIGSTNGISDHLAALRKKGLVTWVDGAARTLRVVKA